jgi:ABC-type Fe3+-hydroxamate transport system substrate-binding protein
MSQPKRLVFALLSVALITAGCGGNSSTTTPTTPTTPTSTTETFEGTITVNGAITHPFVVTAPSTVTATMGTVSTGTDTVIGLALGTWNGEFCQIVLANDAAGEGKFVIGLAQTAGNFCVRVYDSGKLTAPATYSVTVIHQ